MGWLQSRRLRFLAACVAAFFVLLVALRAVFYLFFSEVGETVTATSSALWQTLGWYATAAIEYSNRVASTQKAIPEGATVWPCVRLSAACC